MVDHPQEFLGIHFSNTNELLEFLKHNYIAHRDEIEMLRAELEKFGVKLSSLPATVTPLQVTDGNGTAQAESGTALPEWARRYGETAD